MLRPGNWTKPTGGSPVRVIAGEPGSRPRSVVERRRAERSVESLFGGTERAGRRTTGREPSSPLGKDGRYEPVVQPGGGTREPDGVAAPLIARRNPAGGKLPPATHRKGGRGTGLASQAPRP